MAKVNYRKLYAERYGISIPKGYDIHHIDLDHNNNDITNLLLIPHVLHMRLHECIQYGIHTVAVETLKFKFINMPVHCSSAARALKDYAELYDEVYRWSLAKECEEWRIRGEEGWMRYSYNEFRYE